MGSFIDKIIGPVAGAIVGGGFSALGASQQNKANKAAAAEANRFTADQFARRYQITMADMRKAGLNPLLAYQQGGGSPSAGQQYSAVNVGSAGAQGAVSGANSALAYKSTIANVGATEAQTAHSAESARKLKLENDLFADYYKGVIGKQVYRQQKSDESAGRSGWQGKFFGWWNRQGRDDKPPGGYTSRHFQPGGKHYTPPRKGYR